MRRLSAVLSLGLGLALALPAPAPAADLCPRGATATAVPVTHLFAQDLYKMREKAWLTVNWDDPAIADDIYAYPEAAGLSQAFADWSASLPPALRDLPYLVLLVEVENYPETAVFTLTQGAESDMAARLLDAMDRADLKAEARLLREAIAIFPDWGSHPRDRAHQLYDGAGNIVGQALFDGLSDLSFRWPPPTGRAAAAASALLAQDSTLQARYDARLGRMTEDERLDWLMQQLWTQCLAPFSTPAEADAAHFSGGSVQGALLVLDGLMLDVWEGTLDGYFYGYNGTMAPQAALLLDRRGLADQAAALREAMGLFGPDYPRDTYARQVVLDAFDPAQLDRMLDIGSRIDAQALRAEMIVMARDAGLLPGGAAP